MFIWSLWQQVAYGTFNIKNPSTGKKEKIARVIRQRTNEELARNIAAFLKEHDFDCPSRATIIKILKYMPAATSKEMRGINSAVEESKKGFRALEDTINELSAIMNNPYPQKEYDNLLTSVRTAEKYFKCHFIYNISTNNPVASHCIQHACSDPGTVGPNFLKIPAS